MGFAYFAVVSYEGGSPCGVEKLLEVKNGKNPKSRI
jgi:hypothetical protein